MTKAQGETARRWVHLLFGSMAFLLPYLDWRFSLIVALFAVVVNLEFLPRTAVGRSWLRPNEGPMGGIVLYPITVALLIVIYREATLPVACAWVTLAAGDPAAAFFGQRYGAKKLPWNSDKTWAGSLAFLGTALLPSLIVCHQHGLTWSHMVGFSFIGSTVGAIVESIRWPIADNFAIGLSVSFVVAALGVVL